METKIFTEEKTLNLAWFDELTKELAKSGKEDDFVIDVEDIVTLTGVDKSDIKRRYLVPELNENYDYELSIRNIAERSKHIKKGGENKENIMLSAVGAIQLMMLIPKSDITRQFRKHLSRTYLNYQKDITRKTGIYKAQLQQQTKKIESQKKEISNLKLDIDILEAYESKYKKILSLPDDAGSGQIMSRIKDYLTYLDNAEDELMTNPRLQFESYISDTSFQWTLTDIQKCANYKLGSKYIRDNIILKIDGKGKRLLNTKGEEKPIVYKEGIDWSQERNESNIYGEIKLTNKAAIKIILNSRSVKGVDISKTDFPEVLKFLGTYITTNKINSRELQLM